MRGSDFWARPFHRSQVGTTAFGGSGGAANASGTALTTGNNSVLVSANAIGGQGNGTATAAAAGVSGSGTVQVSSSATGGSPRLFTLDSFAVYTDLLALPEQE